MTLEGLYPSNTFEKKLLEHMTAGTSIPVEVIAQDLRPLLKRIEELESRPAPAVVEKHEIPVNVAPQIVERIIENTFDPSPIDQQLEAAAALIAALQTRNLALERQMQAVLQDQADSQRRHRESAALIEYILENGRSIKDQPIGVSQ